MRAVRDPKHIQAIPTQEFEKESFRDASAPGARVSNGTVARLDRAIPRGFARVPTHAVGAANERRSYPRAALRLPMRLQRVAGLAEIHAITLLTKNISSSGVFFMCPRGIEPGTAIELEVALVDRPLGKGSVRMTTAAHVVRAEATDTPGWHCLAATFDDISFHRDEPIPPRFQES